MRKLLIIFVLATAPFAGFGQYLWDFGGHVGASNYLGEMGGKANTRKDFVTDMKLSKTQFTLGAFGRYKVNEYVSLKLGADWVRIGGDDYLSTNPGRAGRNLDKRPSWRVWPPRQRSGSSPADRQPTRPPRY